MKGEKNFAVQRDPAPFDWLSRRWMVVELNAYPHLRENRTVSRHRFRRMALRACARVTRLSVDPQTQTSSSIPLVDARVRMTDSSRGRS